VSRAIAAMALAATACSSGSGTARSSTSAAATTTTGRFGALPAGCDGTPVAADAAPLAFVTRGRVFAVDPAAARPAAHCLFETADAGLFSWGPRGDRVVLRGMQVQAIGSAPSRPPGRVQVSYFSWSRPTGTTVVFIDPPQTRLERADMGTAATRDITPIPGLKYGDLAYHPSGVSIGFVVQGPANARTGIWMATNQGQNPVQLVSVPATTAIRHIVFAHDGTGLLYSVDRGAEHMLARYDLASGQAATDLWTGDAPIADIIETAGQPGVALTVGATCTEHRAIYAPLDATGQPLTVPVSGPTSVIGRVDADRFVVGVGGCDGPMDLYLVNRSDGPATLLVNDVDAAASRAPEPTPPPPLPPKLPASGFG